MRVASWMREGWRTLGSIVDRHEVLRTVFREQDEPGRKYWKKGWKLSVVEGVEQLEPHLEELIRRPFYLSGDHMLRCELIRMGKEHVLVLVLHHIAWDGWSYP